MHKLRHIKAQHEDSNEKSNRNKRILQVRLADLQKPNNYKEKPESNECVSRSSTSFVQRSAFLGFEMNAESSIRTIRSPPIETLELRVR